MTIVQDIATLQAQSIVTFYTLSIPNVPVLRLHPGVNEFGESVLWNGLAYMPFPLAADGFEKSSSGALPRPKLTISNKGGLVAALLRQHGDAIGCAIIRQRTFKKYLDAANFVAGNPQADPTQEFPRETWFVARRALESPEYVTIELASPWDVMGTKLPRRQIMATICPWRYRGDGCFYAGGPVADESDNPTSDPLRDSCSKTLRGCKFRFGEYGPLPFGSFPASLLMRGT